MINLTRYWDTEVRLVYALSVGMSITQVMQMDSWICDLATCDDAPTNFGCCRKSVRLAPSLAVERPALGELRQ